MAVSGKGGRGKRGIKSRIAAAEGVTKQAIEKSEQRAAEAIGEPVDLDRDSPAELRAKADKVRSAPKPPKAKAAPKPRPAKRMARRSRSASTTCS